MPASELAARLVPVVAVLALLAGCGDDFAICTDPAGNPTDCEVCSNALDDDLDGRIDCRDHDCNAAAFCSPEQAEAREPGSAVDADPEVDARSVPGAGG